MELADGQILTLAQLQSKGATYQGKPLNFEQADKDNPFVYVASTKLSDEELAAGNNDVVFTFSLGDATGNVVKTVNVLSDEDRAKAVERVKAKQGEESQPQNVNIQTEKLEIKTQGQQNRK